MATGSSPTSLLATAWSPAATGSTACAASSASGQFTREGAAYAAKPGPPVHDDLVERHFVARQPDQLWLTDLTEHPTAEGKLYLCAIKDACSNRIVGYSMADRMTAQLAVDALSNAIALRRPSGTVVHSDRGSQFRSHAFLRALHEHRLVGSMGRVGACADNGAMESFFSLLQKNVLNRRRWTHRQERRREVLGTELGHEGIPKIGPAVSQQLGPHSQRWRCWGGGVRPTCRVRP